MENFKKMVDILRDLIYNIYRVTERTTVTAAVHQ